MNTDLKTVEATATMRIGRDWSRELSPTPCAKTTVFERKNYGVTVTVWGPVSPCDTFGAHMVVSLDTEYQYNIQTESNDILSYQVLAYGRGGEMAELIFHIPDDRIGYRLSLSEIVDETRKALGIRPALLKYKTKRKPGAIRLIAHFAAAEWAALRDRDKLASVLQIIRKSPITLGAQSVTLKLSNRSVTCGVEVVDTTLIAPAPFRALGAIGKVLGLPKVTLPQGAISRMQDLRREDPELFNRYAITDTRIALAYYLEMQRIARDVLGLDTLGPTLGSVATSTYINTIGESAYLRYFGLVKTKLNHKTVIVPVAEREQTESFAAAAFMGGLNMAYLRSLSRCLILDIDFSPCYPSAAASLAAIDWSGPRDGKTHADDEIHNDQTHAPISISYVEFEFPQDCMRPTIPVVAGSRGIIYPRRGEGYATHFELQAARAKGAKISVLREVNFPPTKSPDGRVELAFASFFKMMVEERNKYPKGSLENLTFKEGANSVYGKCAQGVKPRNMRSFAKSTTLPKSRITCPAYACAITGLVRAALIDLMDASEDVGGVMLAATTDGAMIAFPHIPYAPKRFQDGNPVFEIHDVPGLHEAIMSKPAIKALSQGRINMGCGPDVVEVKHAGDEVIVMKTRGYILRAGGKVQHLARCGHQIDGATQDDRASKLEAMYNSDRIGTWKMKYLSSAQKVWDETTLDIINISNERRTNVDFDFKVIPDGQGNFRPPEDLAEFQSWRDTVDNIRREPKPSKGGDVQAAHRATLGRVLLARAGIRVRGDEEATLRRMFLYAVVQNIASLHPITPEGKPITQAELARRAKVRVTDIKNAKRRTFIPVPRTEIALHVLLELLQDTHLYAMPVTPGMDCLFT